MKTLDVEAIQAFVLVADLNSFTRAAEAMDSTQSAVSLKIKLLEDGLGRRLIDRTPRLVRLSAEGIAFLPAARNLVTAHQSAIDSFAVEHRRLTVGISHHIVGAELTTLLRRMNGSDPALVVELHIDASRDVLAAFDNGELEAAIVLRHDAKRRDG
jgi:DNA-binding transcriptional LysR family regulator